MYRSTSFSQAPCLTSLDLDSNSLKSYHPMSNLSLISTVLETTVKCQLLDHFQENSLLHPNQSAYRPGHSVETVLLDVYASLLSALARQWKVCISSNA